VSRIMIKIRCK